MKKVYVAHPFKGKRENMQAITHICQRLVNFGIMPISPVHAFSFLNDKVSKDRDRALRFCEILVSTADEIWFFGDWKQSEGCGREIQTAVDKLVTIRIVTGWKGDIPIFENDAPKWLPCSENLK